MLLKQQGLCDIKMLNMQKLLYLLVLLIWGCPATRFPVNSDCIYHIDFIQVRASNLQELVYKAGQAGVTKATVTITFDNSDKKQSPVGYETFDEITVSRQVNGELSNF